MKGQTHMKIRWLIVATLTVTACIGLGEAEPVKLVVNTDKVVQKIDDKIYGQFLEHIYHSASNGLWGEVVWNRSFEEPTPTGSRGRGAAVPTELPWANVPARHWSKVGGAELSLDTDRPLNSWHILRIVAAEAGQGVSQANFCLRKGDTLRGSLWLRGEAPDGLIVRLVNGEATLAEQTIAAPEVDWAEFPLTLTPSEAANAATLQIVSNGKASVWLDQVSLMPDSFKANGGFRTDLLKAVADLKPTTIRWPGGGFVFWYRWKDGIGPQDKRRDKGRVQWDDMDSMAFGLDEFISLCHKVGAEPVVVIWIGPRKQTEPYPQYIQEALDLLEYCNGPADSTWGKVRAANGHPEPYNVKYWEIDNEVYNLDRAFPEDVAPFSTDIYLKIATAYAEAFKNKDPSVVLIGCGGGGNTMRGWIPRVLQAGPKLWDFTSIHYYQDARRRGGSDGETDLYGKGVMESDRFFADIREDIAKSSNPKLKVYESEWNFNSIDWRTGLYAGGILNVMERNSDIVPMACPALWLRHVTAPGWDNAFINFDNRTWFGAPNYVVMKLYRDHFAPYLLSITGETGGLNVNATKSTDGKQVILKVVNPTEQTIEANFDLQGSFKVAQAKLSLVAPDSLTARNSLDQPNAVKPEEKPLAHEGNMVHLSLPRWSVGVLKLEK
jgi:alpha-N-arabinofuranosidase